MADPDRLPIRTRRSTESAPELPYVPLRSLAPFFGERAVERAQRLVDADDVFDLGWNSSRRVGTGWVQDGVGQPFSCEVTLIERHTRDREANLPQWQPTVGLCTCPIAMNCAHCAAVVLALSQDAVRRRDRPSTDAQREKETPARPAVSEWRTALSSLLRDDSTENTAEPVPLAIGFELDAERLERAAYQWGQEPATPEHITAGKTLFLKIRPLKRGKANRWIKSGLSWRTFEFRMRDLGYELPHAEALHRIFSVAESERSHVSGTVEHLWINSINTDLIWEALAAARDAGVEFVGLGSVRSVTLGDTAEVGLVVGAQPDAGDESGAPAEPDATAEPAASGVPAASAGSPSLTLSPAVTIDGVEHSPVRALGAHGVLAITGASRAGRTGAQFDLLIAGLREPMPSQLQSLLARPEPLLIPAEEREVFLAEAYPRLRRSVPVTARDDSVQLPTIRPATLHLRAQYARGDALDLTWSWRYHDPERTLPIDQARGTRRTLEHEDEVLARVRMLWPTAGQDHTERLHGVDTAQFTSDVLDRLAEEDNVSVQITGTRHEYRELDVAPHVRVTQTPQPGKNDWFDLGFQITIDGHSIAFPTLFTALAKGQSAVLMPDRTYFSIDRPEFDVLRRLISEGEQIAEWEPDAQQISHYHLDLWEDIDAVAEETRVCAEWERSVGRLLQLETLPEPEVPACVHAQLRPYQRDGLRWLTFLWEHQLGGILADDMGLGKTLQTLTLIALARERQAAAGDSPKPFLVVAPSSVLSVWRDEAERFTPSLDVRVIDQTRRARGTWADHEAAGADVIITSYTILRIDSADFQRMELDGLILDEAQFVKNRAARVHQVAKSLQAPFRLAITGTPMENSLADLWALLSLTAAGLFPSRIGFQKRFTQPIESGEHPERMEVLRRRIRPFVLRRTKELVAKDLPGKQEQMLRVQLESAHRRLYDSVLQRERKKVLGLLDEMDKNRFIVFRSLTLLRMLALDPAIVDDGEHAGIESSKLNALFATLTEVLAEGHRVLVFSQFTSFLRRVADRLDESGVAFSYLDGSTRNRAEVIAEFRAGASQVFLMSLKAGGFGLTLTEADYVFLLDPWWNPAAEAQAVDRAHRIGQTRNVMVYRLVAADTIEEKVLALQEKKAALFSSLTDGGEAFSAALSVEDIRSLLSDDSAADHTV